MARAKTAKAPRKAVRQARQARSRATVATIVEAATRILARDGWDSLNTNAIAARAGVSVGSVYEYFPNKQAILDVVLESHLARGEVLINERASQVASDPDPLAVVRLLVDGYISVHQDDPRLHRVLSGEVPLSKAQRQRIDSLRSQVVSLVTIALEGQVPRPGIKANLIVDTADALAHRWLVDEVGVPASPDVMQTELERMLSLYVVS